MRKRMCKLRGLQFMLLVEVVCTFQLNHLHQPTGRHNRLQQAYYDKSKTHLASSSNEKEGEWARFQTGVGDLRTGEAFGDASNFKKLLTMEDVIGVGALFPLSYEALHTAFSGTFSDESYVICAAVTLLCSFSHAKMTVDTPRDFRAPRLAEYRTVYEFSALYLVPFSWFLWRITYKFPKQLESLDLVFCSIFTLITIYGFAYAFYSKNELDRANNDNDYDGPILPSSKEYQEQAQLYLTGNIAINGLACLFIPFIFTLAIRGDSWWQRVQNLHPNEAAFMGVSVLVATIGDVSGNLLLRLKELGVLKSEPSIVVMGVLSNWWLIFFPEIIFNGFYNQGVSEVGFYWE